MSMTEQRSLRLVGPRLRPTDMVAPPRRQERAAQRRSHPRSGGQGNRSALLLAVLGAVAYCSWPLAFIVNPSLAGGAFASSFESRTQPFSWLFILLDCISGLCAVIVCLHFLRLRHQQRMPNQALVFALLGYAAFGVATAVDAVIPLHCGASSARACAAQLWPITPDDLLTGIAILALFVALAIVSLQMVRTRPHSALPAAIGMATVGWSVLGLFVLVGATSSSAVAFAQYGFLTVASLLTVVVPLAAASEVRRRSSGLVPEKSAPERGLSGDRVTFGQWPGELASDRAYSVTREPLARPFSQRGGREQPGQEPLSSVM